MTKNTSAAPRKAISSTPAKRRDARARLIAAAVIASADLDRPELIGEVGIGQLREALHIRPQQVVNVRAEARQHRKLVSDQALRFLIDQLALDRIDLGAAAFQQLIHLR